MEAADAPVGFGTKLAFALGTARRLEHDEADRVFGFCCAGEEHTGPGGSPGGVMPSGSSGSGRSTQTSGTGTTVVNKTQQQQEKKQVDVYVREKVRVESADPSLLSLAAKLTALGHTLGLARRNLAAVMGEELED